MTDTITTGSVSGAEPEGHTQAMLDKVDQHTEALNKQTQGEPQEAPSEETLIGGKFKSQDDLLAAYQALEKKQSQGTKKDPEGETAEPPTEPITEEAEKAVEAAGIDVAGMSDYFAEKGELSEDHYKALEKIGLTKDYVDTYIEGIQAKSENLRNSIIKEVGGDEEFSAMSAWGAANLSPEALADYNKAMDSSDPAQVRSAVMGLAYQYQKVSGKEPTLMDGETGTSAGDAYGSVAEMTADMKKPEYKKDPAFRAQVEAKLSRSNIF